MSNNKIDPTSIPATYTWIKKVADEIVPKYNGEIKIECVESMDADTYYFDRHMYIFEEEAPKNFFQKLFNKQNRHVIFVTVTPCSDSALLSGKIANQGNFEEYPEIKSLVEQYSPHFKKQ